MKFKFIKQQDQRDSGPTCLRMIAKFYGNNYSIQEIRKLSKISRDGVLMLGLEEAALAMGFATQQVIIQQEELNQLTLPCILNWRLSHYVVLFKITKNKYYIADPTKGIIRFQKKDFHEIWYGRTEFAGVCLTMSLTPVFFQQRSSTNNSKRTWLKKLYYFSEYKHLLRQLLIGFLLGSLFQLITPFLTQAIVDQGINTQNIQLIYIILIAQLMLVLGNMSVNFIRSWILLSISTKINITLLTQFLYKLMNLPISFFETKTEGDLIQRMNDQQKIESFLTGTTINTFFSLFNLLIFGVVLAFYNSTIFYVFVLGTILYTSWIVFFLKPKRELNYLQFENAAMNQSSVIELINGIQDIKLNQSEELKRWDWERLQVALYKYKTKLLKINQLQSAGSVFINQVKSIVITFLSVRAVMAGELTLGGMMAIQYIIGQINNPVEQFLSFLQGFQDAKISLERLDEIHDLKDDLQKSEGSQTELPANKGITVTNLSFRYPVAGSPLALNNINLVIPQGKVTAIVGMSGSGKTTIIKLLLKFYEPEKGDIFIGDVNIDHIDYSFWRSKCGTVLPDAFIFSDTIANNIAMGDANPDENKLTMAIKTANLSDYIASLPSGMETRIGSRGNGVSLGQKQRLLIARAVYKNPDYLFFDEATNALDSLNEEIIMRNLKEFFYGKTVVVVAHRLSTVKDADQIIVMDSSRIAECGTHNQLVALQGIYFKLVKNQLAIGA